MEGATLDEVWLPVYNFEKYEVCREGLIRHRSNKPFGQDSKVEVMTFENEEGELMARLWLGREVHERSVSALIEETFKGWDDD